VNQLPTRAFDCKSTLHREIFDDQQHFDIPPAINALAGGGLLRAQLGELFLPGPQGVLSDVHDSFHLADLEP
jgi:hypothetical protein